jgi:hypothetical protein
VLFLRAALKVGPATTDRRMCSRLLPT